MLKASVYDKTQAKDIIKDLSQMKTDYFPKDAEKYKLLFQKKVFNSTFGKPKTDYLKEGGLLANVYSQIFFAESKRDSLIGDFSPRLYKNMDNEFTRARIAGLGTYLNFLYNNNCLKNFSDYQILGKPFNPIRYANGKIILPNGTTYNINQLFTSDGMFANKEIASLFYNGELTHKQLEKLFDIKKKFFYNDKLDLLKSMLINAVKQFKEPNAIAGELLTEMNTAKRSDAFYRDIMTKGENINDYPNMYNLFLIANEMEDNGISPTIDGIPWKDKFDSAIREHTNTSSSYLAMPEFTAIINSNIVSFKPNEIVKNLKEIAGQLPSSLKAFINKPLPQWTQSNLDTFMRDAILPIIDNYKSYLPDHISDAEKDLIIEDMVSKYSPDSDNYILKEFAKNPNLEGKSKYQEIAMLMRTAQMLTDLERAFIPNAKYNKKKAMINPFSKAYVERLWKEHTTSPIICSKDEVILKSNKGEYTLRDIIDPSTMTQKEIHKLPFMQRHLFEPLKLIQDKIFASTTQIGEINANYSQTREAVIKSGGKDNIDSLKDYAAKFLPFQKDVANDLNELAEMIMYWKEQLDNNKDLQELAFGNNYTTTFDKVIEDFNALRDILLDDRGADRIGRKFIYSEENVEALYNAVNEIKEEGYKNYIKPMREAWQSIEKMGEDYQFIEKGIDENGNEITNNRKNEIKRIYAQVNQFINKEVRENPTYYRNEDGTWITDNIYNAVLSKTNDLVSNFFNPEGNYGGSPIYTKDGREYMFTLDDANKLVDKIVNDYAGEEGLFYRSQDVSPTRIYYDKMKELVKKYNYKFKETNIFGDNSEMFSKEFHLLTQPEKRILGNIAKHTILNSVNSYIDGLKIKVNQKQVLNSENGVSEGKIKDLVSLEQEIMERVPFEDIVEMFMIDPNK
ncbi:MAG TPA: hypothetical protein PKI46_03135, partial [Bacteroidales bacterium]|nr:hypothetical protein [Bacteroidales bacterium]